MLRPAGAARLGERGPRRAGPEHVAAIVLETVVGTNGVIPPPDGYLAGVREICDEHGIVLIADEVMAGFGRTGKWFAFEHFDIVPDIITFAKGVNSGYVPLGGVAISTACEAPSRRVWMPDFCWRSSVARAFSAASAVAISALRVSSASM